MTDIYRDQPPVPPGVVRLPIPSQVSVLVAGANIDRLVAVVVSNRALSDREPLQELATLVHANGVVPDEDLRLMFGVMLQRLADQA